MVRDVSLAIRGVAAYLEQSDEQRICSWLLVGLADQRFDDFLPADEVPIREQIKSVYVMCSVRTQETFKRAVARAIAEWEPRARQTSVLRELALLAAETRASATIPALRAVLDRHKLRDLSPAEVKATTSSIIAVIGGFTGVVEAAAYLRQLFFSPWVSDEYRGQLFIALCEAAPHEYARYLPRFIDAMNALGDYFVPELVFRKFVRVVGFELIASQLGSLDSDVKRALLNHTSSIFYEVHEGLAPDTRHQFYRHLSDPLLAAAPPKGRFSADRGFTLEDMPDESELRSNVTYLSAYLKAPGATDSYLGALADELPTRRPRPTGTENSSR